MDLEDVYAALDAEFGAAGPNRPQQLDVVSGDRCGVCGVALVLEDLSLVCPECGADHEAADLGELLESARADGRVASHRRSRLRMVGDGGRRFQGKLDAVCPIPPAEQQRQVLTNELRSWNEAFEGAGGNPFPRNVLARVVEVYNQIQRIEVKRSDKKRVILAAILYHVCLEFGFSRRAVDCARFAGLQKLGLAPGEAYLRSQIEAGRIAGFRLIADQCEQILTLSFAQLGLDPAERATAWAATLEVFNTAKRNHIAQDSETKSKVLGALVTVLVRGGEPRSVLKTITEACRIRRYTLTNVLEKLELQFHKTFFRPVYEKHGLAAGKYDGWHPKKKKKKK